MRVLLGLACAAALALTSCSVSLPYELVCAANNEDRLSEEECIAVAEAAISEFGAPDEADLVAVQAFRRCPPGATCGLRLEEVSHPLSALVGVRMADGTSAMLSVVEVTTRPLVAATTSGFDPDEFIDGLARRRGALRP